MTLRAWICPNMPSCPFLLSKRVYVSAMGFCETPAHDLNPIESPHNRQPDPEKHGIVTEYVSGCADGCCEEEHHNERDEIEQAAHRPSGWITVEAEKSAEIPKCAGCHTLSYACFGFGRAGRRWGCSGAAVRAIRHTKSNGRSTIGAGDGWLPLHTLQGIEAERDKTFDRAIVQICGNTGLHGIQRGFVTLMLGLKHRMPFLKYH